MKRELAAFIGLVAVTVVACTDARSVQPSASPLGWLQGRWTLHYFSLATKSEETSQFTARAGGNHVAFVQIGKSPADWYLRASISPEDNHLHWDRKWPDNSENCFEVTRGIQPVEGHVSEDRRTVTFSEPLYVSGSCRPLEVKETWSLTRD